MDFVLPQSVLNVALFNLVAPLVIEMVDLTSHLAAVLQIVGLVDL